MKTYIGVKLIEAMPMDLGEYNKYRGWTIPPDEDPERMGWLVKYPDGYESWSPAEAFSGAYREVEGGFMNFGLALEALKKGHRIARKGWNGKNMFLFLLPAGRIPVSAIHDSMLKVVILAELLDDPDRQQGEEKESHFNALASIRMFTADKKILTGWLASQTDMLSDDWFIVK